MFRNFCVVFLAALTTLILLLTFYIARSDLSLRLILFSAGDVLYIKNILPVVATAIPPFAGLSGLIYFAGRKHLVLIVLFFLSSLFCFVLYTDFVTVFLPGTLHEDKNFRTREQKQADHVLNRLTKNYLSLPQSDILRQNCTRSKPVLKKAEKNVVFIMLESMEYDFNNYKEENLIPNIEKLQKRHLSFSGRATLKPLGNTAAATVAFTYGLPLEMHDILNLVKDYDYRYLTPYPSIVGTFNEAGYQTVFILGSDKKFAHIDSFIKNAGFKEYLDRDKIIARYKRKYPLNDWGISDHDLYAALKDKILNCHHRGQPFFILAQTIETHFPQGLPSPHCPQKNDSMETAVFCADKMLREFLDWAEQQSFYKNTLFVIVGDHLMMSCPFTENITGNRDNVFIVVNGSQSGSIHKPHSALDIAPTVLELSGAKIDKHGFGLGTSLLSTTPTLTERFGAEKLEIELNKRFYE